jgi:hypothetical protein
MMSSPGNRKEGEKKIDLSELFSKAQWHRKYIHYSVSNCIFILTKK